MAETSKDPILNQGCEASIEEDSDEEDQQPEKPAMIYFRPENYTKSCKIGTRCDINKVLIKLEDTISEHELRWFKKGNQFKHLFHMPRERNRRLMGMWMLALRTALLEKRNVWWFIINGVPVWYSMWEHGLISGLNCNEYPEDYENLGSFSFIERQFERTTKIYIKDVEEKMCSLPACEDRLRMAVLFFLSSLMKGKSKVPSPVEQCLLRIVDDLDVCKTFPWGRYTFEDCSKEIEHMMNHFKGEVKEKATWTFPGFIIPLELLAFEAIPALKMNHREDVKNARRDCPRICKWKYKPNGKKGYALYEINDTLGETKDIHSILEPTTDEQELLMARIWDKDFEEDFPDEVAEDIMSHLSAGKKIFWQNLYDQDVESRTVQEIPQDEDEDNSPTPPPSDFNIESMLKLLTEQMEGGFRDVRTQIGIIDEKVERIGIRQKAVKDDVSTKDDYAQMDNDQCSGERYREEENFGFGEGSSAARHGDDMEADIGLGVGGDAGVEAGVEGEMGVGVESGAGVEAEISLGAECPPSLEPIGSWALGPPIPPPIEDLPPLSPRPYADASGSKPPLSSQLKKSGFTRFKMCSKKKMH